MSEGRLLDAPKPGPALPPEWRRYREGFVVLQHVQALTGGPSREGVDVPAIARALGFGPDHAERVVDYLVLQEYLRYTRAGLAVALTPLGSDYLVREAGKRRSVRPRFASAVDRHPPAPEAAPRRLPWRRAAASRLDHALRAAVAGLRRRAGGRFPARVRLLPET